MNLREIWFSGSQIPVALWLVLALALALLLRRQYFRAFPDHPARKLWWFRFAAVALVLVALADLTSRQFQVQLPDLVLVVDTSQSSALPNERVEAGVASKAVTRMDVVRKQLTSERFDDLARRFRLSLWTIDRDAVRSLDDSNPADWLAQLPNTGDSSRLGEGLQQILDYQSGRHTAAVLIFSDGAVTSGESLASAGLAAGQQGIPVFAAGLGSRQLPAGLKLENLQCNQRVRVDETFGLGVDLSATGLNGQACELRIQDKASGEALFRKTVSIDAESFRQNIQARLSFDQPGIHSLVVSVTTLDDQKVGRLKQLYFIKKSSITKSILECKIIAQSAVVQFCFYSIDLKEGFNLGGKA